MHHVLISMPTPLYYKYEKKLFISGIKLTQNLLACNNDVYTAVTSIVRYEIVHYQ